MKNNIRRFFFNEAAAESCPKNYPGLIDAIYIAFMLDGQQEYTKINNLLYILRDLHDNQASVGTYLQSEGFHGQSEQSNPVDDANGCAHLSLPGSASVMENDATLTLRVPIDGDKSSFSCKSQGERYGSTYLSELNVVLKERSVIVSELQHALLHTNLKIGVFFRDANGDTRFMCDPDYPMKIESSDESGEGPTGSSSASIKFSQISKLPPIYYRGKIKYAFNYGSNAESQAGYIDCASGSLSRETEIVTGNG